MRKREVVLGRTADRDNIGGISPVNGEELCLSDIINVLGNEYSDLFAVNVKTRKMQPFRCSGMVFGMQEDSHQDLFYEAAMEEYIENNVASEDKGKLQFAINL